MLGVLNRQRTATFALLLLALLVAPTPAPTMAQSQPRDGERPGWRDPIPLEAWTPLGPIGPGSVQSVGVSSGWPADPFMIAIYRAPDPSTSTERTVRTFNGGQTWEDVATPVPGRTITVIARATNDRIILTLPGSDGARDDAVFRSTDDGQSWTVAARLPTPRTRTRKLPRLVASPAVEADGRLLLIADGELRQSTDWGATWAAIDPAPGQLIQDALFSPAYATDRTLFAVATADDYPSNDPSKFRDVTTAATVSERSSGIVRSEDAGETWHPMSAGLEFEGASFRLVESLAISPTFSQDGTLFAVGWETYSVTIASGAPGASIRTALFQTKDRGESWQIVRTPEARLTGISGAERQYATMALAPDFASSGIALMTVNANYVSPGSRWCQLFFTEDGGESWEQHVEVSSYGGCSGLSFATNDPHTAIWTANFLGGSWRISRDGGATRAELVPREFYSGPSAPIVVARDGTIFHPGRGGIWMFPRIAPTPAATP